ncbi:MAG: diacylglycerol kinase family protein [Bacteroidales bacterium]|nr:diacylglycerol kinase family protein [Bacteroidales bacterium]HOY39359.1 diacylglycerol kinase family protein [Bacteroidales bacterium]HQP03804.1 diacylglycerol kinase family protein [Bacteroidales bacterium]
MKILRSFKYAINGLRIVVTEERNAVIHTIITGAVILSAILLKINHYEWIAIIFAIGFVFVSEIINTVIENLADFVTKENNIDIKRIKDIAAAAVLVSAIVAAIIGLIVFLPRILMLFSFNS